MIIPFVNWGWKRETSPDFSFKSNLNKEFKEFTKISREYDGRLHNFETILDEHQYKEYMDLRNCANRLVLAKDRLDFLNDLNNLT